MVSDHQQSTTPTWWSRVGASGWSVTTNCQPPLPGGGSVDCGFTTTHWHPPLPPPVVLTVGSLPVGGSEPTSTLLVEVGVGASGW